MLNEFILTHRTELIQRCKDKAARRFESTEAPEVVDHGVPMFLQQLADQLYEEPMKPGSPYKEAEPQPAPAPTEIGRAAALQGAEMLRLGYTVDQVVHGYGDICQSVTEMAIEQRLAISTREFRTLNGCLDNAIADAVTAYGKDRQVAIEEESEALGGRLDAFAARQQQLLDTAIQTFIALQTGKVGLNGATAQAHLNSLNALRLMSEQSIAGIRLASAVITVAPEGK